MTRRELRYLFIIGILLQKVRFIERETNDVIALLEADANRKLAELLNKQVEVDTEVIKVWEENTDILWQEKQVLEDKLRQINQKRKEQKRYEKGHLEI